MKSEEREELWQERVQRWRIAGCRSTHIRGNRPIPPVRQFGYWVRRLAGAKLARAAMMPGRVAPVAASAISLRCESGWTLTLPGDVPAMAVRQLRAGRPPCRRHPEPVCHCQAQWTRSCTLAGRHPRTTSNLPQQQDRFIAAVRKHTAVSSDGRWGGWPLTLHSHVLCQHHRAGVPRTQVLRPARCQRQSDCRRSAAPYRPVVRRRAARARTGADSAIECFSTAKAVRLPCSVSMPRRPSVDVQSPTPTTAVKKDSPVHSRSRPFSANPFARPSPLPQQ